MRAVYLILLLLLLLIPIPTYANPAWLSGWGYRRAITISNTGNANTLTGYQVLVTLDTASLISAGKMRSDGGDIRFTDSDGTTLLSYWIESGINTASTKVWVKVPSIPASSTKTIYLYYGNPNAVSASNGDATFDFFDDFNDGTVDTSKWDVGTATYNKYVQENSGLFATNTDLSADESSVSGYYRIYGTAAVDIVVEDGVISGWMGKGLRSVKTFDLSKGLVIEALLYLYSYGQGTAIYRGIDVGLSTIYDKDNRVDFHWRWDASGNQGGSGLWYTKEEAGIRSAALKTAGTLASGATYRFIYKKDTGNTFSANFGGLSGSITSTFNSASARIGLFGDARGVGDSLDARWDWIFVRKYTSPEPTTSVGPEEVLTPTLQTKDFVFTYNYNGYTIWCVGNNANKAFFNDSAYDSAIAINSTAYNFTKVMKLPAGTYSVKINVSNAGGFALGTAKVTVNKATPALSVLASNATYPSSISIVSNENNMGDNDLVYNTYIDGVLVGHLGNFSIRLPVGTHTILLNTSGGQNYTSYSMQRSITVNKGLPVNMSLSCRGGTWIQGATITSSENNIGDSDLIYNTYVTSRLGSLGTFIFKARSGSYTAILNTSGGQNYTSNQLSCSFSITKAWERTDNVKVNESIQYDLGIYDVPVPAFVSSAVLDSAVEVGKYLSVKLTNNVINTNGQSGLADTFSNILANVTIPSGWRNITRTFIVIPSLPYNTQYSYDIIIRSVTVYEKNYLSKTGYWKAVITVNDSKYTPQLPIIMHLHDVKDWSERTNYTIKVDGRTDGFSFDPNTLTLLIPTTFSHSSLDAGDHTVELIYTTANQSSYPSFPSSNTPSTSPLPSSSPYSSPSPSFSSPSSSPSYEIYLGSSSSLENQLILLLLMVILFLLVVLIRKMEERKAWWTR